jgi:hypothetical protein
MWKRREHDLSLVQRSIFGGDISHFGGSDARALTALLIGRRKREFELRVSCDQAAQLPTRVTARAKHSDRNFMHKECITLHSPPVNDPYRVLALRALRC